MLFGKCTGISYKVNHSLLFVEDFVTLCRVS